MTIAIGSDHAGFVLKQAVAAELRKWGNLVEDVGAFDEQPSDYPDYAAAVGRAVASGKCPKGIVICGSGVGASIAANKIDGVRAAVAHDSYSGRQGVEHDDMNVLCLGSRVIGLEVALDVVRAFVGAKFQNEERFVRRLGKVKEIERRHR